MKLGRYIIIVVAFVALLITFGNRGLWDSYQMQKQLHGLESTNQSIVHDNASLAKEIELLKSNFSYIEMIARNELGMVKQGDVVFRISK